VAIVLALLGAAALARESRSARASLPAAASVGPLSQQGLKLTPPNPTFAGVFGYGVALSADGSTALVSAPGASGFAGAGWIFVRSGSTWVQQGERLTATEQVGGGPGEPCLDEGGEVAAECRFGRSFALSADGNTAILGSSGDNHDAGAVWVFTRTGSTWTQQGKKIVANEETIQGRFGKSVALSADGNTALVGGSTDGPGGSAWVLTREGSVWTQSKRLAPANEGGEDFFGRSVALSSDGNTALVGGPGHLGHAGAAWAFVRTGSTWVQQGEMLGATNEQGPANFGYSVALSGDGNTALVGGRDDNGHAGAVWAFARSATGWAQQGEKLTGKGEVGTGEFGYATALSGDGNTALIGAPHDAANAGAAWEFTRSEGTWSQLGEKLTGAGQSGAAWFGASVALSSTAEEALIGGPEDSAKVGAVWTFVASPVAVLPAPSVTSITPTSGPLAGGTPVTITGTGFLPHATVTIGSPATSIHVVSETEITARTAPVSGSPVDEVVVSDGNGTSSGGPTYTYVDVPPPPVTKKPPVQSTEAGTQSAGSSAVPNLGLLSSITLALPPPVLGVSGNLTPVSGTVRIELPGTSTFITLTGARQIPFGTIIDATHGRVTLTTVGPHGALQTITFYEGEFKLTQGHNAQVVATLFGGNFSVCPTARERSHIALAHASRASRKHSVRKLWAEGHGSYSTKGNYAAGAVLGTHWLTQDLCGGTLIRVVSDKVLVTNLVNHRHVTVKAGHSYLAKAP
jgi:hypothetical protein